MNKETSIFSRLSPKSVEILKSINPKYKSVDRISPYDVIVAISFSKMSKTVCDIIMQVFESGFIDEDSNYSLELEALKTTCRQKHIQKIVRMLAMYF